MSTSAPSPSSTSLPTLSEPQLQIQAAVQAAQALAEDVAQKIHARPELRYEEHYAAELLSHELSTHGFRVARPFGGLETAFVGKIGRSDGPKVAILAEYDALPEIGHACGHNLIAAAALAAGLGLKAVEEQLPGEIWILGTPAEEGGGGKIKLIENGVFEALDAAMMFHPYDRTALALGALAKHTLHISFEGTPSHAAAAPWDGHSALNGVIQTFNLIDSLRLTLRDGTRIHGIITDGGQADNIIVERAAAQFSVRAPEAQYLDEEVIPRVKACAEAAALATGTQVKIELERGYKNMVNNMTLAQRFGAHLQALNQPFMVTDPTAGIGSTDMGDVSQVVPGIHPYLAICEQGESICHQHAFANYANSPQGFSSMLIAAQCLALSAFDLLNEPSLLEAVKTEFEQR